MLNGDSYAALLFLRALRSLGESAVHAIAYSVAADVCVPAERGSMLGPMMAAAKSGSLHWASAWRLDCAGFRRFPLGVLRLTPYESVVSIIVKCFFPETARSVVSNESVKGRGGKGLGGVL